MPFGEGAEVVAQAGVGLAGHRRGGVPEHALDRLDVGTAGHGRGRWVSGSPSVTTGTAPLQEEGQPMSTLTVDFIISLDGYGAAEGWPGYWGMEGPEYLAWIEHDAEHEHTALLGATTYRLMSGFAAEMPDEPGLAALTAMPKVVFSSTLEAPLSWANTELVSGDPVETVQDMKRRDSRPLRTVGSLSLCRSLLEAGVVDRFRVVVFPVITGATGRDRIFDGYPDIALELVDSRTFDGRLQLLEYVPTVLDGPPGTGT